MNRVTSPLVSQFIFHKGAEETKGGDRKEANSFVGERNTRWKKGVAKLIEKELRVYRCLERQRTERCKRFAANTSHKSRTHSATATRRE